MEEITYITYRQTALTSVCLCWCSWQELKGKILLKAKKIGGLEGCLDETLTDEVSDEEEVANGDAEGAEDPPAECLNHNAKVDELHTLWFCRLF